MSSLIDALGLGPHELVSLVGAGGKTTTMFQLGAELRSCGRPVVLTTTTKMAAEQRAPDLWVQPYPKDDAKVMGPGVAAIEARFSSNPDLTVIVEADGARHANVKAPCPHEPVLCPSTSMVVCVIGATALDRVIEDQAFRPLRVAAAAECSPYDRLTVDRAARLLASSVGGRKGVTGQMRYAVVIANVSHRYALLADQLAAQLLDSHGIASCVVPNGWPGKTASPVVGHGA
jgi:hypothetical protein